MTFIPVGMRFSAPHGALTINTCSANDTTGIGDEAHWTWCNPTNRKYPVVHPDDLSVKAVSTEAMWQGTKIFVVGGRPDQRTLDGDWRRGKKRRPLGAWAGEGKLLYNTPGSARRAIYIPCYLSQIRRQMHDPEVRRLVRAARGAWETVYLRDFDTGQGIDSNGPMSHAWLLSEILNGGRLGWLETRSQELLLDIWKMMKGEL